MNKYHYNHSEQKQIIKKNNTFNITPNVIDIYSYDISYTKEYSRISVNNAVYNILQQYKLFKNDPNYTILFQIVLTNRKIKALTRKININIINDKDDLSKIVFTFKIKQEYIKYKYIVTDEDRDVIKLNIIKKYHPVNILEHE